MGGCSLWEVQPGGGETGGEIKNAFSFGGGAKQLRAISSSVTSCCKK